MAIYLDIETCAIDDASMFVEAVSAPSNYKDQAKIDAYVAEKQAEQVTRAALYPWTARVVALGVDIGAGPLVSVCPHEADEAHVIRTFWKSIAREHPQYIETIVGFNSRSFDLPVLLARSLLLDIDAPHINLDRYRSPHIDLMDRLTWFGTIPARSLKWYARRFGVPVTDETTGADVAALVAAGQFDKVAEHCHADLVLTRAVAERGRFVRGMKAVA